MKLYSFVCLIGMSLGVVAYTSLYNGTSEVFSMDQDTQDDPEVAEMEAWVNATLSSISPKLQEQLPYTHLVSESNENSWLEILVKEEFRPPENSLFVFIPAEENSLVQSDVFRTRYMVDGYDITVSSVKSAIGIDVANERWIEVPPTLDEIQELVRNIFINGEAVKLARRQGRRRVGDIYEGVFKVSKSQKSTLGTGIWDVQYARVIFVVFKYSHLHNVPVGTGDGMNGLQLPRRDKETRDRLDAAVLKDRKRAQEYDEKYRRKYSPKSSNERRKFFD